MLGRPQSQAQAPRTRLWLLARWQTRSQSDRAPPRKGSRQRWDLVEHKTGPWRPADKHRTIGPSAAPPPGLPPPQMQPLLPLEPPVTICRTMWAHPSLGRDPKQYLEDTPGGRHWLLRICIQKTCSVCLPTCHLLERAAGASPSASVTLPLEPEGAAPGVGPMKI